MADSRVWAERYRPALEALARTRQAVFLPLAYRVRSPLALGNHIHRALAVLAEQSPELAGIKGIVKVWRRKDGVELHLQGTSSSGTVNTRTYPFQLSGTLQTPFPSSVAA